MMQTQTQESTELRRDCEVVLIPAGTRAKLSAGESVVITQTLGGAFTIHTRFGLARVDAADADALGREPAQQQSTAAEGPLTEAQILETLKSCYDPEIPVNIVDLGLIYDVAVTPLPSGGNQVEVKMTLTAPGCGMGQIIAEDVKSRIQQLPGVKEANVALVWDPPWSREMMSEAAKLELGLL